MNEETCALNIRTLPISQRDKFKSICAESGTDMSTAIVNLIREINQGKIKIPNKDKQIRRNSKAPKT
jgi:hypothetical protein